MKNFAYLPLFIMLALQLSLSTLRADTSNSLCSIKRICDEATTKYIQHLLVKEYGVAGKQTLILVHGGPGGGGYMESLGSRLDKKFHIIEYFQRDTPASGLVSPFTVSSHVNDLKLIVNAYKETSPIIIGHSWGAALALAFAGTYPGLVKKIVLIGTGPLNQATRHQFKSTLGSRYTLEAKQKLGKIYQQLMSASTNEEKTKLTLEIIKIIGPFYNADPNSVNEIKITRFDASSAELSGQSYDQYQDNNSFISKMQNISDKVVAIHGDYDPIPHDMVLPLITSHVKRSKNYLLKNCGHFPWLEPNSKHQFFEILSKELKN